ncbi:MULTISPECIES: ABC transporter ATP-binding protein [Marivita]|uniref:ABC transporter ATP-binding protein n=1 Tax=Marivita cryptomonadis TaxID=505252 RepID=A0A9Q2S019_9RHOB|nr:MULTISPECIES: ABC transporter ATP-binding protein [Marivita]MCR9167504.1 ABC transporter ATP-binding protein/permease [Paracoccaceae bacterium]MBM2321886.1 ABC transporter ATP-binding protein [Marivita cryptomonadis]MBM2331487.1 ABC transporter ATP-binding protein [Marivita cryptomonadis]MBM2341073.1 ABC transporter ATP-binding protein [Marivita cryptomonadis]MBM2345735.1 ABC transporter ATP-binding protein [Marivita cryptomonadis]
MRQFYQNLVLRAGNQIDPDAPALGMPPIQLRAFMAWCLRGGWRVVWLGIAISVLAGLTEVVSMQLLGNVVDAVATTPSESFLSDHAGLVVICIFVLLVARPLLFGGLALTQSVMIGPNIGMQVMARMFRWTLGQSVTFFDNDFAGRLAQKKMQASNSLTEIVIETVNAVTFGLATVLGTAFLVGAVSPWMILALVLWFAVYLAFLRVMLPIIRSRSAARAEAKAQVTGQVVDTISNIKTVKLFAGDQHEDGKALGAMEHLRRTALRFGEAQTLFRLGLMFIAGALPVVLVGMAIAMRSTGNVTPGDIAAVGAVGIRLSQMTGWISYTIMVIYSHVGEVEDGMNTLAPAQRIEDAQGASDLVVTDGRIQFDSVTFAYGQREGGIDNVTLDIAAGEKLAVVGASGAGKSTLVSLLLRLYDTEKGRITIDGQDLSQVTQDSLRQQIGMVTQETAMFNRSALDNIRYGRPSATEAEVIRAAEKAEAHEFILSLEDNRGRTGYAVHLGERGVKLSGGQRQRIALARAILKDAPILVLDEATSALDSEVEAQIQSALEHVMEGKTVLAIAHRLSTIASMDRIIVMDAGSIAEVGTHDALLAKDGLYARYWDRQSGGFIGAQAAE